jgi:hypothetical protein
MKKEYDMKTVRILLDTAIMTVLLTAAVYPQFSEQYAGALTGMYNSSAAWGDYDNDGRLDLLVSGWTGSNAMTKLYRNTGAGFTEVYPSVLPPVATASTSGEVAWGDFDNDGLLDILLVGSITRIYRNTGSGFTSVYPGALPGSLLNASGTWITTTTAGWISSCRGTRGVVISRCFSAIPAQVLHPPSPWHLRAPVPSPAVTMTTTEELISF